MGKALIPHEASSHIKRMALCKADSVVQLETMNAASSRTATRSARIEERGALT